MRKALIFIIIAAIVVFGLHYMKTVFPFIPVVGSSMEPTYDAGDLLVIGSKEASEVKVGDVIVFNVPTMVSEYYNYPPVVAHRVTEINKANTVYGVVFFVPRAIMPMRTPLRCGPLT